MSEKFVVGEVLTSAQGQVVRVSHRLHPLDYSEALEAKHPAWAAALAYVFDAAETYGWSKTLMEKVEPPAPGKYDPKEPERLYRSATVGKGAARTVGFERGCFGVPVFREGAAVSVRLRDEALHVLASARAPGGKMPVKPPGVEVVKKALAKPLSTVAEALGNLYPELTGGAEPCVELARVCVARAAPGRGGDTEVFPWANLPPLPPSLAKGAYSVALDVVLGGKVPAFKGGVVRVVIALPSLAILVLEAPGAGAAVTAWTWGWDPITRGTATITSLASSFELNTQKEKFTLTTLVADVIDTARAGFLELDTPANGGAPTGAVVSPDVTDVAGGVLAGVVQVDDALAQIEDLGWVLADYLQGQPAAPSMMIVDGASPLAAGPGYTGNGLTYANALYFGLSTKGTWGSLDRRIVYHEVFGHVTLLNRIGTPNLPFAHSFGDAMAAVYGDVDNPDRANFETFPFAAPASLGNVFPGNLLARRHDRAPSAAMHWGWGAGMFPTNGQDTYQEEQKLSSTIFRCYRALGGDDASATVRRRAARLTAWLVLQTAYRMTALTVPQTPESFALAMMDADADDWTAMGWKGGAYHKVVRWAFEKQGAYTNPVATDAVGKPPAVDVYVHNPRNGEYTYTPSFGTSSGIWNRLAPDGLTGNQAPVSGQTNYVYVKVANRGTTLAVGAKVGVYVATTSINPRFPNDFKKVGKVIGGTVFAKTLTAADVQPLNAASVIVGPFEWIPKSKVVQPVLAVVDHPDDHANTLSFSLAEPIEATRLVPSDNNTGIRGFVVPGFFFKAIGFSKFSLVFRIRGDALGAHVQLEHRLVDAQGSVLKSFRESVAVHPKTKVNHVVTLSSLARLGAPAAGGLLGVPGAVNIVTVAHAGAFPLGEFSWRG